MVVHFEGPAKPWNYFTQHPLRERYWTHLRASGLPAPWRQDAALGNIVRRHTRWLPDPLRAQLLRFLKRAAALRFRSVPTPLAPPQ